MNLRRTLIATIGILSAGLLAAAAPAEAAQTSAATPSTGCDRAPWQAAVQGAPAGFTAGDRGGDYLWHDGTGFHLRVTHRNDSRQVYSGLITSSAPMRIDPVRLERGDVLRLSPDRRSFAFAFADYGRIDGVNFHTDCAATLTVSRLRIGTTALPANRVYLGSMRHIRPPSRSRCTGSEASPGPAVGRPSRASDRFGSTALGG